MFISLLRVFLMAPKARVEAQSESEVKSILKQMEDTVLAFRDEIERAYESRCDPEKLAECSKGNYDDCSSIYPNPQCMDASKFIDSTCGNADNNCNVLWDESQTTVMIPAELADGPMGNPTDPRVIESVCHSRLAEPYMIMNYNYNNAHRMYFGSSEGVFRIIPAYHSETCGSFDPRRRPWFVAASSGPKDVVLVLDVSGSMDGYGRMDVAKDAARTIVETLSFADRFAVITFSDDASQIGGETGLIRATDENKKKMMEHINNLTAGPGETNFYDAFATAFDTIEQTIRDELTNECNVAILFMTDGEITAGPGEDEIISLANQRIQNIKTNFNQTTTIFTYSFGQDADHRVTKRLACETNGIWTQVEDFADDLVTAMSSYYKLYASGLGQGGNEDWVAWIEPYRFVLGGKMGTGVSAPAYDRSVTPPLFLGVAAVDMYMDDFERALGKNASSTTVLDRLVLLSTAHCPRIELSQRELEALRFLGGGEQGKCNVSNHTEDTSIFPMLCLNQDDMPSDVWNNNKMHGKSYSDRACCQIGSTVSSGTCNVPPNPLPTALIVGVTFGALAFILLLSYSIYVWKSSSSVDESASVIVPSSPSAPPFNPTYSATEDA
ncbi:hypothetical protein ACHAW6_011887 [Cyclotella cf. meneghiniana]